MTAVYHCEQPLENQTVVNAMKYGFGNFEVYPNERNDSIPHMAATKYLHDHPSTACKVISEYKPSVDQLLEGCKNLVNGRGLSKRQGGKKTEIHSQTGNFRKLGTVHT